MMSILIAANISFQLQRKLENAFLWTRNKVLNLRIIQSWIWCRIDMLVSWKLWLDLISFSEILKKLLTLCWIAVRKSSKFRYRTGCIKDQSSNRVISVHYWHLWGTKLGNTEDGHPANRSVHQLQVIVV